MCNLTALRPPFKSAAKGRAGEQPFSGTSSKGCSVCEEFNTIIQTKVTSFFLDHPVPVIPNNVSDKILPLPQKKQKTKNLSLFQVLNYSGR